MIIHLAVFFLILFAGGMVWFFLGYFLDYIINWHIVNYPQWSSGASVGFMIAFVDWAFLLLCMLPALIYLLTNTQRPEEQR